MRHESAILVNKISLWMIWTLSTIQDTEEMIIWLEFVNIILWLSYA